ncbi:hypothetical protein [Amphiplicatus metriothermophilus]|uniref:DUF2059 domain-containing protein n=1 Tax=Amphiplicatus metriothermophilus TaxID=1519374 RepID=A0A239PKK3_9PROT|nr:hypothetical protein [Amphiplicatus metriothermophilus]MBB5517575.1 hypothetical protein [Amphiplicatus metriothermophilus]SNT68090.1 hypothetical protein SAMN06297382_0586 [Amphiplicatus metriothermophilus]
MPKIIAAALAGLAALFAAAAFAAAPDVARAPLKGEAVERFIATMAEVEAFGDALEASGRLEALKLQTQPRLGEPFAPFSNTVEALAANHPDEHARLAGIVRPHGFTPASWGETGDRIILAYLAEKMAQEDPEAMAQMAAMDRSMLDQLPPEMKTQMEAVFAMMETVRDADPADRAAVRPYLGALDDQLQ